MKNKTNSYKILYCDSDEIVCKAAEMYFSTAYKNLTFDTAFTNEILLDKLSLSRYDILFYDVGMDQYMEYPLSRKIKNDYSTTLIAISNDLAHHNYLPNFFDDKISSFDICEDTNIFHMLLKMHGIKLKKK